LKTQKTGSRNDHLEKKMIMKGLELIFLKINILKKFFASNGVRFELPGDIDIIDFRKTS